MFHMENYREIQGLISHAILHLWNVYCLFSYISAYWYKNQIGERESYIIKLFFVPG